jgi:ferrochelatase
VYWGNRNWDPLLLDTLAKMKADGVRRAIAFFTSAFSSYSGCRQYRENIVDAQAAIGDGAPQVDKLRAFFNHPGFIAPMVERTREALEQLPADRRAAALLIFTAHSIPGAMAANCRYEAQFQEASRLVATELEHRRWQVAYQSRSGPPSQPWLGPDIGEALERIAAEQAAAKQRADVVVVPIGFVSDHMEVLFDLDEEARQKAVGLGLNLVRAATVGTHPRFVRMIRELVEERMRGDEARPALGELPASHDVCPPDCCRYEARRPAAPQAT